MKYAHYAKFERVRLLAADIYSWLNQPEYSASMPSAVVPGKRWRRHDGSFDPSWPDPAWLLCEYGPEVIGDDGLSRCAIVMKRPLIRIQAISDRMFVVKGADLLDRVFTTVSKKQREQGVRGVLYTQELINFCEETFGYLPKRTVLINLTPLDTRNRAAFVLTFKNAADALAFKLWI